MAKDMSETVRDALGHALKEAVKNVGDHSPKPKKGGGGLSGAKGLAAGAGLAAAAPLAKKGVTAFRNGAMNPANIASKATDKVGSKVKDTVSGKIDQAGGAGGIAKDAASGLIPGMGGGDSDGGGGKNDMPGVGKGRRMPIQQSVDVAVELETAYNQFTQFEDWPEFMHRVTNVTQDEDETIRFSTKIWGKTKEFEAQIVTQRPDDRIKWKVAQGINHSGVASFHELAPRLTRIEITLDVQPGSLIEKAARGMRHIKRAVRADLHRYKAFIEMQEMETGAWRGVIEDGEVVEPHDDSYDEERDYSEVDDLYEEFGSSDEDSDDSDSGGDDEGARGDDDEVARGDDDEGARGDDDSDSDEGPVPVEQLPRDKTGRFSKGAGARPTKAAASSRSSSSRSTSSNGGGSGNGKTSAKSSRSTQKPKSSSSSGSSQTRKSGTRKRGSTNGSGSSQKRTSSSSRRRSSSRS
jgi:uncharacterized membrane protein